jgi:hypothetical protein
MMPQGSLTRLAHYDYTSGLPWSIVRYEVVNLNVEEGMNEQSIHE